MTFIVGMNRWVMRIIAYATLMTDAYRRSAWTRAGSACPPPHPMTSHQHHWWAGSAPPGPAQGLRAALWRARIPGPVLGITAATAWLIWRWRRTRRLAAR